MGDLTLAGRLIERLLDRTKAGSVSWHATADDSVFQVPFPSYVVQLEEKGADYILRLLSEDGVVMEEVTDGELSEAGALIGAFLTMRELFTEARRQAFGVIAAYRDLLDQLGDTK